MRAVENNTFYKRNTLATASVLKANFSDLSLGGSGDTIDLQGGFKESTYTLSGSIPLTPAYGQSELIGGYLSVFVSGVTLSTTPSLPQLELYKLKPGVEVSEGKMSVAYLSGNIANTGINPDTNSDYLDGSDIVVYHSVLDSESMLMSESFDGADKTLGDITIVKSAGTGVVEMSDAYLTFADARSKGIGLGSMLGQRKTYSLRRYFSDGGDVPIKPETDDVNGVWRPQLDSRGTNKKKLIWKKPFWKYKDIKGVIKFKSKSPVGGSADNDVGGSPGNTIFDEVYTTANLNNPFTSSETNPLLMTTCELSTSKKYGGAQSFRMYHLWDYSTASAQLQHSLNSKQISPSVSRASIYNIPYPTWTSATGYGSSAEVHGSSNYPLPEISMRMNIAKLQFTPYLSVSRILGSTDQGFNVGQSYYPSGTGSSTDPTFTAADAHLNTGFTRSVSVTWSNYKPKKDHDTIDKFLDYGLERFYTGETSEHIVGGITFRKTGIDTQNHTVQSRPSVVQASAIPVQSWFGDGSAGTTTITSDAPGPNLKYGLTKFTLTGTTATNATNLGSTMMLGCVDWTNFQSGISSNGGVRQTQLPLDSWFNMRTFIDIQQPNSNLSAQLNTYDNFNKGTEDAYKAAGVPMRVFFESDIPDSGSTSDEDALTKIPYVDVYFPAGAGGNTYGTTGNVAHSMNYNWQDSPDMYPKHMTIWVQNYRWISGTASADQDVWDTYEGSAGIFEYGDSQGAFPSGSAIEAELFVDNIDFKNFKPDITNCSPGASVSTQQPINFRQEGNVGPRQLQTRTDITGWASGPVTRMAWEAEETAVSGNMQVNTSVENLLIGLTDPAQLPVVGTNSYTGFLLFNGFNSMQMGSIERQQPKAAISAMSSFPTSSLHYLGGQNWGVGYWDTAAAFTATTVANNTLYKDSVYTTGDAGDIITSEYTTRTSNLGNKGQINYMTSKNDGLGVSGIGPVSSQDGFTSKGLLRTYCSGTDVSSTVSYSNWTKREHMMASTKIIGVPGFAGKSIERLNDNQLVVDDPTIFNKYLDDEFIIYLVGNSFTTTTITATGNASTKGWGVHADSTSIKLAEGIEIDSANRIITFNTNITLADDGSTTLCNEANLSQLWISPKKYWISMYQPADKVSRSYQNVAIVQDVGADGTENNNPITSGAMGGSTWNESNYGFDSTLVGTTGALLTIDSYGVADGTRIADTYTIATDNYTTLLPTANNTASFTITIDGTGQISAYTIVTGGANYIVAPGVETEFTVPVAYIGGVGNDLTFKAATATSASPPTNWVGRSGLYTSPWNLEPSLTDSTLVTNIDYGYGAYDDTEDTGGEVSQATALINKYVELDITRMAAGNETSPGENIVFRLGINDGGMEKVHIYSDEYTADVGKVPTIFWEYKDELPKFSSPLTLTPNYNILSGSGQNKVDLYKLDREELNAIKFNWGEEGDDILYRLLYISTGSIINKYDGTAFHAPLNDLPNNNKLATGSYYVGASRIKAGNLTPTTTRSITGSAGWAWDGNYANSTTAVDWPQTAASVAWDYFGNTEATFVAHCVPNDTTTQTENVIFTDYSSTRGTFRISYTKVGSANAAVTPVVSLTSGSTIVSGKTVTLTSDYSFPNDGEHPLFIVVTFNSTLDANNIKMYVNGMLVKQSAGNWTKGNNLYNGALYDGKISLGNLTGDTGGTKKLRGTLQECLVHNTELYVPTAADEYILSTASLPDKTAAGGSSIKYTARLFLFDYHNIMGSSKDLVCTSNGVSWEATPI